MSEQTPSIPDTREAPDAEKTEYTDEQYAEYLRYQEQVRLSEPTTTPNFPGPYPESNSQPVLNSVDGAPPIENSTGSVSIEDKGRSVNDAVAASVQNASPNDFARTPNEEPRESVKVTATESATEHMKETASAARDTASAVFSDVKSAVSVASKREPYALLALVSAAFVAVWLAWPENSKIGAQRLKLWTVFVLASVALLFAPMVKKTFRLDATRAWQFAVGGASGLGFAWVAFLLPDISSNQAFFGTLAVAAGGLAVWTAPGRPE